MSYVILTRNPGNKKLVAIAGDDEEIAEFETEELATAAADNTTACKAWGYEIVEVA